jgi:hypothetical protein
MRSLVTTQRYIQGDADAKRKVVVWGCSIELTYPWLSIETVGR